MPPDIPGTNRTSSVPPPASSSSFLPPTNSDTPSAPPIPSSPFSSTSPAVPVQTAVSHIANHDTTTATTPTPPDSSDEDQDYTCPHCDRTFTSHIVLVGHLRIHRTETGEPVPGAPTYTHRTRLYCPQCPRTFTHRMGLFGHMRIHESEIDRSLDTPIPPSPTPNPPPCAPTKHSPADIDATVLTTPHSSPSSSFSSSITATTTAASASVAHDLTTAEPDTTTGTSPATSIIRPVAALDWQMFALGTLTIFVLIIYLRLLTACSYKAELSVPSCLRIGEDLRLVDILLDRFRQHTVFRAQKNVKMHPIITMVFQPARIDKLDFDVENADAIADFLLASSALSKRDLLHFNGFVFNDIAQNVNGQRWKEQTPWRQDALRSLDQLASEASAIALAFSCST
nr:unnamed protein product [Spirometra erinaceieuropaei]